MARWLSWLERRPVTAEVEGSSPFRVAFLYILGSQLSWESTCLTSRGSQVRALLVPLKTKYADMAQLAEQLICNQQVIGSSPIVGFMDGFPSGQRGQTVNLLQLASVVRIHLHPFKNYRGVEQSGSSSGS